MKEETLHDYFIDLDGTLSDTHFNPDTGHYDLGEPLPRMVDAVNNCAKEHNIVVFSARPVTEYDEVSRWLQEHGITHSEITNIKRPALKYIDDKGQDPQTFASIWNPRRDYGTRKPNR